MPKDPASRSKAHDGAHDEAHQEFTEVEAKILPLVAKSPKSRLEVVLCLGRNVGGGHLYKSIHRLRGPGFVELTIPDKPRSGSQRIRIAEQGAAWLTKR